MADPRGFAIALQDFKREIDQKGKAFVAEVALQAITQVVQNSPVGNPSIWKRKTAPKGYVGGAFRRDWQLEVNQRPVGSRATGADATGGDAINAAVSKLLGLPSLEQLRAVYVTNTRAYAEPLEDGHSRQAPAGVVGPAKAAIEAKFGRGRP
jgi:hypothetical protein